MLSDICEFVVSEIKLIYSNCSFSRRHYIISLQTSLQVTAIFSMGIMVSCHCLLSVIISTDCLLFSDAGPSASSVLRSLLKRKENSLSPASTPAPPPPPVPPNPPSASSTLRAMLKQRPLAPPPAWSLPHQPQNWPQPPPVSSNRLKALLGSPLGTSKEAGKKDLNGTEDKNREQVYNEGETKTDKESRKRVADLTNDILDVLKRKRSSPPPPSRNMPAALRPTGTVTEKHTETNSKSGTEKTHTSPTAATNQSPERRKQLDSEISELLSETSEKERQPSPHHPILFSILKEQNLKTKLKEETERKDHDEDTAIQHSKVSLMSLNGIFESTLLFFV